MCEEEDFAIEYVALKKKKKITGIMLLFFFFTRSNII